MLTKTATHTLECAHLVKRYGAQTVLHGVDLHVRDGQIVALLGPSGCGKTTTLRLIAGFELPDEGRILIGGRVITDRDTAVPVEQRQVGMVFQEYALFPHLNIADNISFGLRGTAREKAARVAEMMSLVGLAGLEKRMPHELSGGQQQRVALARALAPQPHVLLLDEPFSNLDTALRAQVRSEVKAILREAGITCVLVTHDQEEALSLADEIAVMFDGQIAQKADAQTLYQRPATRAVATFVGEANFLPATADGDRADCALGTIPLQEASHGAVSLMLRPEQLRLTMDGEGAWAIVRWREFYGHDQRVGIVLDSGETLVARTDGSAHFVIDEMVRVRLDGSARAFPESAT
ncbi:MAG: ABC transporter ATP-binding protein [Anaerolineae bacterium]|nr:ABC transporter ATP-binding protein [Anaerolineae bacterium]